MFRGSVKVKVLFAGCGSSKMCCSLVLVAFSRVVTIMGWFLMCGDVWLRYSISWSMGDYWSSADSSVMLRL